MFSGRAVARSSVVGTRAVHAEARIKELGLKLPVASIPKAAFGVMFCVVDNVAYLGGHLPQVRSFRLTKLQCDECYSSSTYMFKNE